MNLTLRQHVSRLERRLKQLSHEVMKTGDRKMANRVDAEIRAANMALAHYSAALELELAAMELPLKKARRIREKSAQLRKQSHQLRASLKKG